MKKIISIVIAVIFVLSMIVAGTACKQQTAAETTAAAESTAAETTAVDTTTVVAEGKELMIFQMPYWSAPVARGWEKGGQIMAKYLGIEVIWKGDTWDDMENDTVEAKAAFAMKPAAVLTLA
ncbi:MAG: hypothetical protein M1308_24335, partial [Actinobacteria bacterium]|nr:hypothetical protein [Actinomycetota bacterium]